MSSTDKSSRKTTDNKLIVGDDNNQKDIRTIQFFKSVSFMCNGLLPERNHAIVEYPVEIDGKVIVARTNAVAWLETLRRNNEALFQYINHNCFSNERFDQKANTVRILTDAIHNAVRKVTPFIEVRIRLGRTGDITLYSALNILISGYKANIESAEWARETYRNREKMKRIEAAIRENEKTIITNDLDIMVTKTGKRNSCLSRIRKVTQYV